ncbi:type IV secretory system conjugative DNA transfer family protein [Streptomyces violascens]|uniref:type IV secretory system conjugative DNA transfer family protein n=1 Tax=Streptomyces violascens TaxID=67381 RepID=UPI003684E03B
MSGTGTPRGGERGGIPDGLLVGLLAFLLGLTVLVWTATGLGGLFTHGAWPPAVSFTQSPMALRSLATSPQDLPAAWPDTPPNSLSGYGLFWGLLIGELMILLVLTIFALGTFTRWRGVRARARQAAGSGTAVSTAPEPPSPQAVDRASTFAAGNPSAFAVGAPSATPSPPVVGNRSAGRLGSPLVERSRDLGEGWAQRTPPAGTPLIAPDPGQPVAPGPTPPTDPGYEQPAHPTPLEQIPTPRVEANPRLLYGAPEARRPRALQAIQDAEGAALIVTSDPTLWAETKDARAKLGPVHVYDPTHRCDTPARLHWSPTAGCEDPDTAAARATALLAPVRPQARMDAAMADTAETLLRCWLHAAALESRDGKAATKQLHRWAQGTAIQDAVRILRTHPKAQSGGAGLLESALTAYPERREIAQELTARALACLSSIHIRDACTPNRADSLALESFVNEGGTLYVVGEPIENPRSHPAAMPLLTALASDVVERGRRMAERSSDGRLDPPMTIVLDDVAAVAPLPRLPELLSTGQDQGMPPLVLLRSPEQARARWAEALT